MSVAGVGVCVRGRERVFRAVVGRARPTLVLRDSRPRLLLHRRAVRVRHVAGEQGDPTGGQGRQPDPSTSRVRLCRYAAMTACAS